MRFLDLSKNKVLYIYEGGGCLYDGWDSTVNPPCYYSHLRLGGHCPAIEFVPMSDNVNLYTPLSIIPKGIAKGKNFSFVKNPEDADYCVIPNNSILVYMHSFECNTLLYSKEADQYVVYDSETMLTHYDALLARLAYRTGCTDFEKVFEGEIKGVSGDIKTYVALKKYNLKAVRCFGPDSFAEYVFSGYPNFDESDFRDIFRMLCSSDSQTKELGIKMLIQYNPKNYAVPIAYALCPSANSGLQEAVQHSSYARFYKEHVKTLAKQEHGMSDYALRSNYDWRYKTAENLTPEEVSFFEWLDKTYIKPS